MRTHLKSRVFASMLAVAAAAPLTLATSIAAPNAAEAGVISSVKSAAKKVGSAVKTTGKGFVAAGKAAGAAGKQAVKAVGKATKSQPIKAIRKAFVRVATSKR